MHTFEEKLNKIIVARDREIEAFQKQFDRVLQGEMGLIVITGKPGVGKTFFAKQAIAIFEDSKITYVEGKFRQTDNDPLSAISEVVELTIRYLLTLPSNSLEHITNDLRQKLGPDLAVLISLCPYAQKLSGDYIRVNAKNIKQFKNRVGKAVCEFFAIVSEVLFPLIVFIDDLQWADDLSLDVIEAMCAGNEFLNFHLVLAYRNNNGGSAPLNLTKISIDNEALIELHELSDADIDAYLQLIFEPGIQNKDYLVRIIYALTLGSPFYINRIIKLFWRENVISYSSENRQWLVEIDRINDLNLPADIEHLIMKQLAGLKDENRNLLNLIACFDNKIDYETLKILTGAESSVLQNQLDDLCRTSLLVKTVTHNQSNTGFNYGFVHDIVLKLVDQGLNVGDKSKIHYQIAKRLSDKNGEFAENKRLFIASHLLKADRDLLKNDSPDKWINELYLAGVTAKEAGAMEQALRIFEFCADLLPHSDVKEKDKQSIKVQLELGECLFTCEKVEEARQRFDELLAKHPETETLLAVKRKYLNLYACNGDFEKVLELGLEILTHLNLKLERKFLFIDLIKSRLLFSYKRIGRLNNAPEITDQRILSVLETLTIMAPSAECVDDKTAAMIALKLSLLSLKHGNSVYAPNAYATYCYVLLHILRDPKRAKKLEDIVLMLMRQPRNSSLKIAYFILGTFVTHWLGPLKNTIGYLEKSVEEGAREGEFLFSSYAITFSVITKYVMGVPLAELKRYINQGRKNQQRLEHYLTCCIYDIYADHMHQLKEGKAVEKAPSQMENEYYENKELFAEFIALNSDMIKLHRLYLEGETESAYRLTAEIAPQVDRHKGFVLNVDFLFYSILTRVAVHKDLQDVEQRQNKKLIKKYLNELKYWVGIYNGNHYARYLMAQAEYDALFTKGKVTEKLYREAIDFSEKQGNLPLAALANLLAAKHFSSDRKLSLFYGKEAVNLFRNWGAGYIADLKADEIGLENEPEPAQTEAKREVETKNSDDLLYHLNKTESMPEDECCLYILDLFIKNNYAEYCAVLFEKSGEMHLKFEKRPDQQAQVHQDLINMNHLSYLPHRIIRYVVRTETEVLLNNKPSGGIFAKDPCLTDKDKMSLMCIPIKDSGVLTGIVYLEKWCEDGFSTEISSFVKAFIPALTAGKASDKETNVRSIFCPNDNSLFTDRELEVLRSVAAGMSNSDIGKHLFITQGTVRNHLSNIYAKLEVDNRVKAVIKAKNLKLIQ